MDKTFLNDVWCLYFHDPYDMEWDNKSYKLLSVINSVEDFVEIYIVFKDLFSRGMFFIMREHIMPKWEDEFNKKGGCFSYKINKPEFDTKWFNICSNLLGENIGRKDDYSGYVNGISISPKKNYYIIRVWINDKTKANRDYYNFDSPKYSTIIYKNHIE